MDHRGVRARGGEACTTPGRLIAPRSHCRACDKTPPHPQCGQGLPFVGVTYIRCPALGMPPRRTIHKDVPFVDPHRHETLEQRIRRLRPDLYVDTPLGLQAGEQPSSSPGTLPPGPSRQPTASARPSPYPPCSSNTITRRDAPVVCNTRRGSASDAIAALHVRGGNALEAELRKDKVAQSSTAPVASLWKTWQG